LKVAVYHSNLDVRVEERPRPAIGPDEILMRVEASGVCGSDVMEWYRLPKAPIVLGHEVAGVVEQAGDAVHGFAPGDRIVATHHVPCMKCRYCRTAVNVERGTFKLPDGVSFEEASFVEPLACVVRALRLSRLRADDSVAVLGAGVSGILMIQMARHLGAGRVVATDVHDARLEMATRFGADAVLRGDDPEAVERILAANDSTGIEQVLVCTGARPVAEQALRLADLGGTVLFFAPLDPGETLPLEMNDLWKRGLRIVHSYAGPPDDMRAALELIAARAVDVAGMITHRVPLDETAEAFRLMLEGGPSLKVIVQP